MDVMMMMMMMTIVVRVIVITKMYRIWYVGTEDFTLELSLLSYLGNFFKGKTGFVLLPFPSQSRRPKFNLARLFPALEFTCYAARNFTVSSRTRGSVRLQGRRKATERTARTRVSKPRRSLHLFFRQISTSLSSRALCAASRDQKPDTKQPEARQALVVQG